MKVKEPTIAYQSKSKPFTYQDYALLPDDGQLHQVIHGELIMTPSAITKHQKIVGKLYALMLMYVESNHLGEIYPAPLDVVLDDFNIVQPDILFISNKNNKIIGEKNIQGAPDLVVEILSPSTGYYDLVSKKDLYAHHGVKEYWIVDPKEQWIEIFENTGKGFITKIKVTEKGEVFSTVLTGLAINLEAIFSSNF